jgi:beta-lactamase superfamily II metal-dependent hydrolase
MEIWRRLVGYEIDFLPVGDSNGDAICIRYGKRDGFFIHVTDGAFKDTGESIIKHIETFYGNNVYINNMVLSHACNDHAPGLIPVLERFEVKALWMNRPWRFAKETLDSFHGRYTHQGLIDAMKDKHPYLVKLEQLAVKKGTPVNDAFQGEWIGNFLVLAPSKERYIRLIPDLDKTPQSYAEAKGVVGKLVEAVKGAVEHVLERWDFETLDENPPATSASNETCIVQLGLIDGHKILLTADVGPEGLNEAAEYAAVRGVLAPPEFVQMPHHGSRRNVTPSILDRWLGARDVDGRSSTNIKAVLYDLDL